MKNIAFALLLGVSSLFAYPNILDYSLDFDQQGAIFIPSHPNTPRYAFVFSKTENKVSVVDLFSREVTTTLSTSGFTVSACSIIADSKIYFVTNQSDQWSVLDFSQNIESPDLITVGSNTSSVNFESIDCLTVAEQNYIVLSDFESDRVYSYSLADNSLNQQLDIGYTPIDIAIIAPRNQIVVMGDQGELESYQVPSLQRLGNRVELSDFSSISNFNQLSSVSLENTSYIFISNPISSASEILVAQADHQNFLLSMVDFDGVSGINPMVLDTLIGNIYVGLTQRPQDFSTPRAYLYAENLTDNRLEIIDPYVNDIPSNWQEIESISSVSSFASDGAFIDINNNLYLLDDNNNGLNVVSDLPRVTLINPDFNVSNESAYNLTVQSNVSGLVRIQLMSNELLSSLPQTVKTLASSDVSANQNKTLSFETNDFVEGINLLGVFVESGSLEGYRGLKVLKDTVPPPPSQFNLKFGNQKVFVNWSGVDQADIDAYEITFGLDTQAINGAGLDNPVLINHTGSGSYSYTINGLVNGQKIYAKIKTLDQQGNESEFSAILSETPEETIGLIGLTGETGCQSGGKNSFGFILSVFLFSNLWLKKHRTQR